MHITAEHIATLTSAIGLVSVIAALVEKRQVLPRWARKLVAALGSDQVENALSISAKFVRQPNETRDQLNLRRRNDAVLYLLNVARKNAMPVDTNTLNALVELALKLYKKARK